MFRAIERNEVSGRTTDLSAIKATRPVGLPNGGYRLLVTPRGALAIGSPGRANGMRGLATTSSGRALIEFTEVPRHRRVRLRHHRVFPRAAQSLTDEETSSCIAMRNI